MTTHSPRRGALLFAAALLAGTTTGCAAAPMLAGDWTLTLHADDSLPALTRQIAGSVTLISDSIHSQRYHGHFAADIALLFGAATVDSSVGGEAGADVGLYLRLGEGADRGEVELHADRLAPDHIRGRWQQVFGDSTPFRGGTFVIRRVR